MSFDGKAWPINQPGPFWFISNKSQVSPHSLFTRDHCLWNVREGKYSSPPKKQNKTDATDLYQDFYCLKKTGRYIILNSPKSMSVLASKIHYGFGDISWYKSSFGHYSDLNLLIFSMSVRCMMLVSSQLDRWFYNHRPSNLLWDYLSPIIRVYAEVDYCIQWMVNYFLWPLLSCDKSNVYVSAPVLSMDR